jgi:hypothetical protein
VRAQRSSDLAFANNKNPGISRCSIAGGGPAFSMSCTRVLFEGLQFGRWNIPSVGYVSQEGYGFFRSSLTGTVNYCPIARRAGFKVRLWSISIRNELRWFGGSWSIGDADRWSATAVQVKKKFGTAEPIADCKRLKVNSQPNLLCIQSYDHRSQEKGLPAS